MSMSVSSISSSGATSANFLDPRCTFLMISATSPVSPTMPRKWCVTSFATDGNQSSLSFRIWLVISRIVVARIEGDVDGKVTSFLVGDDDTFNVLIESVDVTFLILEDQPLDVQLGLSSVHVNVRSPQRGTRPLQIASG